jgi:hypothetical protein
MREGGGCQSPSLGPKTSIILIQGPALGIVTTLFLCLRSVNNDNIVGSSLSKNVLGPK